MWAMADSDTSVVWLSGAILTPLNKLVLPALWLAGVLGLPAWVWAKNGRVSLAPEFRFIALFAVAATVLLGWLTVHLRGVGYRGTSLVVRNPWKQALIPFGQVEAVEPVWWYKGRLVRIRFRSPTPFGDVVYYIPKWAVLRSFGSPEEDLRAIMRNTRQ
jgi:hypothetical protein